MRDVRLDSEPAQPFRPAEEIEEGVHLRFEAADVALARIDGRRHADREPALLAEDEGRWRDEAFQLVIEGCDRCEARRREIIFEARVVIVGLEVLEVRVTAAGADLAVGDRRVAAAWRTPDADRWIEIEELRACASLRRGEPQLQLTGEMQRRVEIGQPVGLAAGIADRIEHEPGRGVDALSAVKVAVCVDSAKTELTVQGHSAEVECPVRLDVAGEALLVRPEACQRIVGGRIIVRETGEEPELADIVADARIGRSQPEGRERRVVGAAEARTE